MMIQMLRQMNADYSTPEGEILLFHDTTESLLRTIAEHVKSGAFSTFKVSSYPANFLNAGQCIFAVDSTAGATWMGTNAPLLDISADQLVEFETEVMTIPQFDPKHPQMISQGPSVCIFNKKDSQEVLASWLFVQYLLSDKVQIAYSKTEGYVPVTSKAQSTAEYQAYLSDCGKDNTEHYNVKIKAAKLLLYNTDHTFVTPVFNGSASLRDAAGMLIEHTVKSVRRGQEIDEAYFDTLYNDITSRYRLDQIGENGTSVAYGKSDPGPLPQTAILLLTALGGTWILILIYASSRILRRKRKKTEKKSS